MAHSAINNSAYGFNNPLQSLSPNPVIAKRDPNSNDAGQLGQLWIYNNIVWCLTSSGTWTQLSN